MVSDDLSELKDLILIDEAKNVEKQQRKGLFTDRNGKPLGITLLHRRYNLTILPAYIFGTRSKASPCIIYT